MVLVSAHLRSCTQCGGRIPAERPPQARYCSPQCKRRADYERHGENRRATVRRRYADEHGSPGTPVVRVFLCQQCGARLPRDGSPHTRYCSDLCKWRHAAATRRSSRDSRPCLWCGVPFTPAENERPHVEYCSEYCRNKRNSSDNAVQRAVTKANWRHSRRAKIAGSVVSRRDWEQLVSQYRGCCAYCGCRPTVLTQDHVIPVIRGGAHVASNIVPACQPCNSSKGDKFLSEWKRTPGYALRMRDAESRI